jgi:REP element-mobilizing transposase RayT
MSDKFQNQYRIPSARADWWDYGWNAAYFVTICTAYRECYFGDIIPVDTGTCPVSDDKIGDDPETGHCPVSTNVMQLSEVGRLAEKFWWSIPEHFPFVKLDAIVVMPNHIHGILIIDKQKNDDEPVATDPKTPGEIRFRNQGKNTLSSIIGSYKSVVTKHANLVHADFEWQERFHDHIIRDRDEYCRIAAYIENNVANWSNDKFYK